MPVVPAGETGCGGGCGCGVGVGRMGIVTFLAPVDSIHLFLLRVAYHSVRKCKELSHTDIDEQNEYDIFGHIGWCWMLPDGTRGS